MGFSYIRTTREVVVLRILNLSSQINAAMPFFITDITVILRDSLGIDRGLHWQIREVSLRDIMLPLWLQKKARCACVLNTGGWNLDSQKTNKQKEKLRGNVQSKHIQFKSKINLYLTFRLQWSCSNMITSSISECFSHSL